MARSAEYVLEKILERLGNFFNPTGRLNVGIGEITAQDSLRVISPPLSVATACSGQISVATAGTAVQGSDVTNPAGFYLKAHPDNTDTVWVGNNGAGDITNLNSYPLNPGEQILVSVANLNQLWFDSDVNGGKICWHRA